MWISTCIYLRRDIPAFMPTRLFIILVSWWNQWELKMMAEVIDSSVNNRRNILHCDKTRWLYGNEKTVNTEPKTGTYDTQWRMRGVGKGVSGRGWLSLVCSLRRDRWERRRNPLSRFENGIEGRSSVFWVITSAVRVLLVVLDLVRNKLNTTRCLQVESPGNKVQ